MNYSAVLEKVKEYIISLFETNRRTDLCYHNISHTQFVVSSSMQIADHYKLNDQDYFVVIAAAWFHDIGYLFGPAEIHEENGIEIAERILRENNISIPIINSIKGCILATKMPQQPTGLLQQIVCDADLFHLGTDIFLEKNKMLRKEIEMTSNQHIKKAVWRNSTIELIIKHEYFTDYARLLLNAKKEENAKDLLGKHGNKLPLKILKLENKYSPNELTLADTSLEIDGHFRNPINEIKKNDNRPEKSVDTVFKIVSSNNQRLSSQADSKAHIMIQVNSIIVSVVLSLILRKIEENKGLAIPTLMLLITNILAIIYSVLATRPKISHGIFTGKEIDQKNVNLLFFGNYFKMPLVEYTSGMLRMMGDLDFIHRSLIRDVYFQGIALSRKYRLLRISYNIFMFGLIACVIAFGIAVFLVGKL